jgi:hypothetical protein
MHEIAKNARNYQWLNKIKCTILECENQNKNTLNMVW